MDFECRTANDILRVTLSGTWLPGSQETGSRMVEEALVRAIESNPATRKVLVNCLELDYKMGNSFLNPFVAALRRRFELTGLTDLELAFFAKGCTADAVLSLIEMSGFKQLLGFKGVFGSVEDAGKVLSSNSID